MYRKKFGQNYLINNTIAEKIINLSNLQDQNILEIGPGNLALSKIIIKKKPKKFVAIEIDKEVYDKAKKFFFENSSQIVNADALKINEIKYFGNEKFIIISNLPFNISSLLLIKWLKIKSNYNQIKQMILMFQKELVERIISTVNSKYYGRLSILTSAFFSAKKEILISKDNFFPVPKVDAAVVVFDPLAQNKINPDKFKKLEELTFFFFNSRRKKNKKKITKIFTKKQIEKYSLNKLYNLRPENIEPSIYYNMCSIKN